MTPSDLPLAEPSTASAVWTGPHHIEFFDQGHRIAVVVAVPNDQAHRVAFTLSGQALGVFVQATDSSGPGATREVQSIYLPADVVVEDAELVYGDNAITVVAPRSPEAQIELVREEELLARFDEMLDRLQAARTHEEIVASLELSAEEIHAFTTTVDPSTVNWEDILLFNQAVAAKVALRVSIGGLTTPPQGQPA